VVETDRSDPVAAAEVARRALRHVLGSDEGWRVKPVAAESRDLDLTPPPEWQVRTPGEAFEIARGLREQAHIRDAEASFVGPGLVDPDARHRLARAARSGAGADDVNPNCEWSLGLTGVQNAWALPLPAGGRALGEGIVVAHPDTGYTTHPEIWDANPSQRRLKSELGFDFWEGDQSSLDDLDDGLLQFPGHGTATASVIMSAAGNHSHPRFVSGVAPMAELVPFRVSPSVIHLSMKNVTKAIAHATAQGHHVVSMSLGGPFPSRALKRAIDAACDNGIIVLAAAGNVWPWVVYPAAYDRVIAVAACDHRRNMWQFSATGEAVDVTAPGANVWVARAAAGDPPRYEVGPGSGTSFAVATTAGITALWLAFHGRAQLIARYGAANLAAVFRDLLVAQGVETPPDWDGDSCGAGIVHAAKLLDAALPAPRARSAPRTRRAMRPPWAHYFADLDPAEVENALVEILRTRPAHLQPLLERLGDEVVFLLATEPELRDAVRQRTTKTKSRSAPGRRTPGRRATRAPDAVLRKASPALRKQLGR
jgi:thermitase